MEVTPTNPFTGNGICTPSSWECSANLFASVQLSTSSFQDACKAQDQALTQKKEEKKKRFQNPGKTTWMRGGFGETATASPSLQALSYSNVGPKTFSARIVSVTFLVLVPLRNGGILFLYAHLPRGQGDSSVRQLRDQGAVCFPDEKNLRRRTCTLIYSCDRLRTVRWGGSGMRLINSCVWRQQTGLAAASRCAGSWSRCHPHSPPSSPCCMCSAGGLRW